MAMPPAGPRAPASGSAGRPCTLSISVFDFQDLGIWDLGYATSTSHFACDCGATMSAPHLPHAPVAPLSSLTQRGEKLNRATPSSFNLAPCLDSLPALTNAPSGLREASENEVGLPQCVMRLYCYCPCPRLQCSQCPRGSTRPCQALRQFQGFGDEAPR